MRPLTLVYLYLRRLRTHPVQELLAGLGITIGVALTCAVQIANHSVTGSAAETVRELGGSDTLQLTARSPRGVPEGIVGQVRRLPAVGTATGLFEERAVLTGPTGRSASAHLVGALPRTGRARRAAASRAFDRRHRAPARASCSRARWRRCSTPCPPKAPAAQNVSVRLSLRGRSAPVEVIQAPGPDRVGSFANGSAAVMPRAQLQTIARLPGRVTRVLVKPRPGHTGAARRQLAHMAGPGLSLGRPSDEVRLLEQATGPSDRASSFFTLIAAAVGWLLAFNAMLLSAPERRRAIAELRLQGYRHGQLVQIALFQAGVLGVVASAAGLAVGVLLARDVLAESADYLANAFSFGTQTVVPRLALILSFAGGVIATCLAAAPPLLALRRREALGVAYGDAAGQRPDAERTRSSPAGARSAAGPRDRGGAADRDRDRRDPPAGARAAAGTADDRHDGRHDAALADGSRRQADDGRAGTVDGAAGHAARARAHRDRGARGVRQRGGRQRTAGPPARHLRVLRTLCALGRSVGRAPRRQPDDQGLPTGRSRTTARGIARRRCACARIAAATSTSPTGACGSSLARPGRPSRYRSPRSSPARPTCSTRACARVAG